MTRYITVDDQILRASVSVIHDAKKHIDKYPSVAADAHTAERTAKHLLTRIVNFCLGRLRLVYQWIPGCKRFLETSSPLEAVALCGWDTFPSLLQ